MKKCFISIEGILADHQLIKRPYSNEFINKFKSAGYQVFLVSEKGMEHAGRVSEKLEFPEVSGFVTKNMVKDLEPDIVVDTNPSYMKTFQGWCIKEFNSLRDENDTTLKKIIG